MTHDLLISGDLVLPDRVVPDGYVAVQGEKIVELGSGPRPAAHTTIDATGKLVAPGFVDGQIHACSRAGYEGIEAATYDAVLGGVTTVVDMPYDKAGPVNTAEVMRIKVAALGEYALCDMACYATLPSAGELRHVAELAEAGACAFKFSSYNNDPVRFPRLTPPRLLEVLQEVVKTGLIAGLHNEDQETVTYFTEKFSKDGFLSVSDYEKSRPVAAEMLATAMWLELGAQTGARVHVVHSSVARGFELAEHYRQMDVDATVEMVLHYLWFSDEDTRRQGGRLKVGPPIRPKGEKDKLWQCLKGGLSPFVSTDYGAYGAELKSDANMLKNMAGVPTLENFVPAFLTAAVSQQGMSLPEAVAYISEGPADFFGLAPQKGALRVGADADITLLERKTWTFQEQEGLSRVGWSPFNGKSFDFRVDATYLRGERVFGDGKVWAQPGQGRFLRPS